jgi:hypothetical protein
MSHLKRGIKHNEMGFPRLGPLLSRHVDVDGTRSDDKHGEVHRRNIIQANCLALNIHEAFTVKLGDFPATYETSSLAGGVCVNGAESSSMNVLLGAQKTSLGRCKQFTVRFLMWPFTFDRFVYL